MATFQTHRSFARARRHQPLPLNPTKLITFGSLRSARDFVRGYVCVSRVVARRFVRVRRFGRITEAPQFIVCHPSTAKRNGWAVV